MPKENPYLIKENYKKVEEVREIDSKYEVPSFEEFMKSYEYDESLNYDDLTFSDIGDKGKGYGPCVNSLCGCDCSSRECTCKNAEVSTCSEGSFKGANLSVSGRARKEEIDVGGELSGSLFRIKDHTGDARFFSRSVRGEINKDNIKVSAGANLVEFKSNGFEGRAGINVDSGISTSSDTFETKVAGFGFSVGKKNGISTPFGEIKIDKDECVIQ